MRLLLALIAVITFSESCGNSNVTATHSNKDTLNQIYDFAPAKVGNSWIYQVRFAYLHLGDPLSDEENFVRAIKLVKIQDTQDIKTFIFDIIDSGLRINTSFSSYPYKADSIAIQRRFSDACTQLGDSIRIGFTFNFLYSMHMDTVVGNIRFLPFYESHAIESTDSGMSKIIYIKDSLFEFSPMHFNPASLSGPAGIWKIRYIQNIGLDSLEALSFGNAHVSCFLKLISFLILP
jgi:hypothetical protein